MDKNYPCPTCGRLDPCRCYQRPVPANVYYKLKAEYDHLVSSFKAGADLLASQPPMMILTPELAEKLLPIGWRCAGCQRQYSPQVKWCIVCPMDDEHAK